MKTATLKIVEQWDIFELTLKGPDDGCMNVNLGAEFRHDERCIGINGFYDGNGLYRVRFMPDQAGEWHYTTQSNCSELDGVAGSFVSTPPGNHNHGMVRVQHRYHFAYDDGRSYYPFGTTCYAWTHQGETLEEQTLNTLRSAPFNKVRMCIFPKHYPYNENEPVYHPFEPCDSGELRFNPAFFQHFEKRVGELRDMGIEADVILFHPYDRWGYAKMDEEHDIRYLRYVIARLAAYRNVWWSLANEYDFLLKDKPLERWERFFAILREEDPYQHLRSIHQADPQMVYDQPDVTHVSIQNWDVKQVKTWRTTYGKPIVNDELEYEGNIPFPWGNITAQELVHRAWIMVTNGGYAGHGETYEHPNDLLWWSKGGVLWGESWKRLAFLKQIMDEGPAGGLSPREDSWVWTRVSGGMGMNGNYCLFYFGEHQPVSWGIDLPDQDYTIDLIDTWNMTISPGTLRPVRQFSPYPATHEIVLPGKPYLAVRIKPLD